MLIRTEILWVEIKSNTKSTSRFSLAIRIVVFRSENLWYSTSPNWSFYRKFSLLCSSRKIFFQSFQIDATTKIIVPLDVNLVWSTKVHLFFYRFVSMWNTTNDQEQNLKEKQISTSSKTNHTVMLNLEKTAHVSFQLSNDCR